MGDRNRSERASYVICVTGALDPAAWAPRFPEFRIARDATGNTTLTGEVIDQSAFYGLLSRVRDAGLMVVSVERHDPPDAAEPGGDGSM